MKVKREALVLNNVISYTVNCGANEWMDYASDLYDDIIRSEMYSIGPMICRIRNVDGNDIREITISYSINTKIELEEGTKYKFEEIINIEDCLMCRESEFEGSTENARGEIEKHAKAIHVELDKRFFNNVYLDFYGDVIVDVYAPIKKVQ